MALTIKDFVPVGSVVAIASSSVWSLPSAGQVKNGFALCDGQPFSSLPSGTYHPSFSGNRPSLRDERFLLGSNVPGTTGGANLFKLTSAHMPQITTGNQSANHTHAFSGTVGWIQQNHRHYVGAWSGGDDTEHTHGGSTGGQSSGHTHDYDDSYWNDDGAANADSWDNGDDFGHNVDRNPAGVMNYADRDHSHGISGTGWINANHRHYMSNTSGGQSQTHSHAFSVGSANQSANHTHTFGNSTPSDIDNRPLFFSVVYVIRVK